MVCGELPALSVIVTVPVRAPAAVGVKVTEIVQLPPSARLAPQLCVSAKSPDAVIEVITRAAVPESVSVTVWAALVVPSICEAKERLVGESVTAGAATTGGVPVPLKATVCGEPLALSVIVSAPVRLPAAVGVKVTEMVHVAPVATLLPHVCASAKSPDALMEVIESAAVPAFVSVTVCAVLVEPVDCDGKVRLAAERVTDGAEVIAMPTPFRAMLWMAYGFVAFSELSVNVSEPEIDPAVVGVKLIE